jgi:hypothetical protein
MRIFADFGRFYIITVFGPQESMFYAIVGGGGPCFAYPNSRLAI